MAEGERETAGSAGGGLFGADVDVCRRRERNGDDVAVGVAKSDPNRGMCIMRRLKDGREKALWAADAAAAFMSASAQMMKGDWPPSSRETRFMWAAAAAMIDLPVIVSPVKAIFLEMGLSTSSAPTSPPGPCTWVTAEGTPMYLSANVRDVSTSRERGRLTRSTHLA